MSGFAVDLRGDFIQFLFGLADESIADLRHAFQIPLALLSGFFDLQLLEFFFQGARFRDDVLLLLPLGFERV